jgi:hypothetical protein
MYDADIQSMDAAAKGAKLDATTNNWCFVYDAKNVKETEERILEWALMLGFTRFQCCKLRA